MARDLPSLNGNVASKYDRALWCVVDMSISLARFLLLGSLPNNHTGSRVIRDGLTAVCRCGSDTNTHTGSRVISYLTGASKYANAARYLNANETHSHSAGLMSWWCGVLVSQCPGDVLDYGCGASPASVINKHAYYEGGFLSTPSPLLGPLTRRRRGGPTESKFFYTALFYRKVDF